jgi:ankyrin repeat protein
LDGIKLLIDYANKNKIILDINKQNKLKANQLLISIKNKSISILKLLFDYANDHDIILNINQNDNGNYPLLNSIKSNEYEMVELLIDYAM